LYFYYSHYISHYITPLAALSCQNRTDFSTFVTSGLTAHAKYATMVISGDPMHDFYDAVITDNGSFLAGRVSEACRHPR